VPGVAGQDREGDAAFERLASLTARLASTARLDEIVNTVLGEIVELGFGAVWMATLDEKTGHLLTLKEVIDGVDTTQEMPKIFMLDMRQPIGHGFRERRMVNIVDPDSLYIIESEDSVIPPDRLALPRVIYEHLRGHPFACGPLLGSRGQPVGALGLSSYRGKRPIPDEVLSHGLLRAFMDHLGIAMERALHLARLEQLNADLLKAQDVIARDARIKAVGELAAAVAHDLNNLSGVVLLAASVGMRSAADARDALPRIERATRTIGDLVSRLQRVSGHGANGGGEVGHLDQVIDDTVMMVRPILQEDSIELSLDSANAPPVMCDPVLLHQIVLNLILNARDALVTVETGRRKLGLRILHDRDQVRLIVEDSGPGIAAEVMPQLFRPFVTTKGAGHVGVGLAAVHASLKHIGGKIEGRNSIHGGAVFEVTLVAAAAPPVEAAIPAARPAPHRTGSILAIDDDVDVADVVRAFLEPLGYRVVISHEPDLALGIATAEPFDLILCDVGLPKQSGLDVCQQLRAAGFCGRLVLMTGWDSRVVMADRRAAGCDMLLKKPFLGTELLQVVDTLLSE
jgi:signal transduction histidine kinase